MFLLFIFFFQVTPDDGRTENGCGRKALGSRKGEVFIEKIVGSHLFVKQENVNTGMLVMWGARTQRCRV